MTPAVTPAVTRQTPGAAPTTARAGIPLAYDLF
jgi:hypothetical protein